MDKRDETDMKNRLNGQNGHKNGHKLTVRKYGQNGHESGQNGHKNGQEDKRA